MTSSCEACSRYGQFSMCTEVWFARSSRESEASLFLITPVTPTFPPRREQVGCFADDRGRADGIDHEVHAAVPQPTGDGLQVRVEQQVRPRVIADPLHAPWLVPHAADPGRAGHAEEVDQGEPHGAVPVDEGGLAGPETEVAYGAEALLEGQDDPAVDRIDLWRDEQGARVSLGGDSQLFHGLVVREHRVLHHVGPHAVERGAGHDAAMGIEIDVSPPDAPDLLPRLDDFTDPLVAEDHGELGPVPCLPRRR